LLPDGSPAEVSVSQVLVARGDIRRVPRAIKPSSGEVVPTGEDDTP
jgi:hypothetical protein